MPKHKHINSGDKICTYVLVLTMKGNWNTSVKGLLTGDYSVGYKTVVPPEHSYNNIIMLVTTCLLGFASDLGDNKDVALVLGLTCTSKAY